MHFCLQNSQLYRQHQNLYLLANQEDLTPERFYNPGFITELQRFFCHIGNLWNLNSFGVLQFPIEFALQITWTFKCYDPTSTLEKGCYKCLITRFYHENLFLWLLLFLRFSRSTIFF